MVATGRYTPFISAAVRGGSDGERGAAKKGAPPQQPRRRSRTPAPRRPAPPKPAGDVVSAAAAKAAWLLGYLHKLPRVKMAAGLVLFVTFGVLFLTSDVADWSERQFVSVRADGGVHSSVTWSFPVAVVVLAALVFLSGAAQVACGHMYTTGESRQGVDVSGTLEAMTVEPLVLAILAVASGVSTTDTITALFLSCLIAAVLNGVAKLVRRFVANSGAGVGAAAPSEDDSSVSLESLLCFFRPSSLPWVFSAIAVGTRVVVYGFVVHALATNADDADAKEAAGISGTTIGIIVAAFVAMLACDVYALFDVAREGPFSSSVPHAPTHSFTHTVRFLVAALVIVGIGTALLVET